MFAIDRLAGVLVALASPLKRDGSVDVPAFARLVEHVIAGGVHGLLPLGSTGEGAALDEPARRTVLKGVVEAAAGRLSVICGVAQPDLPCARAQVDASWPLGAEASLVVPTFHY